MTSATELWKLFESGNPIGSEEVENDRCTPVLDDGSPPSVDRIAAAFVHDAQMLQSVLAGFALQQLGQVAELSWTAVRLATRAVEATAESVRRVRALEVELVRFSPSPESGPEGEEAGPEEPRPARPGSARRFPSSIDAPSSH